MKKALITLFLSLTLVFCINMSALANPLPKMYLVSDNPAQDRGWVEQAKDNKATGQMKMQLPNGTVLYDGKLKQIKCRGNSSFYDSAKKSYQIKLSDEADLMETGLEEEANKTWVLLASSFDDSFLRNAITFDMAKALKFEYTHNYRFIDLYYDGIYRGLYLLTEKTEIGSGRIDIRNLEKDIEKANPGIEDFDALTVERGKTSGGTLCQYVKGVTLPEKYAGGYLLEIDYRERAEDEKSWFCTKQGLTIVVKSPEYLPFEALDYIYRLFQSFEDALYNNGTDPTTGQALENFIDLDSLAKVYLVEELSMDYDAFLSSNFFYKPENEEKLYAGPLWDFDNAYYTKNIEGRMIRYQGLGAARTTFGAALINYNPLKEKVKEYYSGILYKTVKNECVLIPEMYKIFSESLIADAAIWPQYSRGDGKAAANKLARFLSQRNEYLYDIIMKWDENPVKNGDFFDVYPSDWYYEDVKYTAEEGIINGENPGLFYANHTMTRAMVITVLYRLAGSPVAEGKSFADVKEGSWYAKAVCWATKEGITVGTSENLFSPAKSVSRQEFVTFLYRFAGEPVTYGDYSTFKDAVSVSDWADTAMGWACANNIMKGDNTGYLQPNGTLLRCQGAAFLHRFCNYIK